jgi:hypothetical protein
VFPNAFLKMFPIAPVFYIIRFVQISTPMYVNWKGEINGVQLFLFRNWGPKRCFHWGHCSKFFANEPINMAPLKKKVKSCEATHDLINMNHTTHGLHQLQKLSDTYIYTAEISTVEFSPCVWVLVWPSNPPFNPQFQCFIPNPPRIWTNSWVTSILLHLFRKEPERNLVLISSSSPSDLTPTKRRDP